MPPVTAHGPSCPEWPVPVGVSGDLDQASAWEAVPGTVIVLRDPPALMEPVPMAVGKEGATGVPGFCVASIPREWLCLRERGGIYTLSSFGMGSAHPLGPRGLPWPGWGSLCQAAWVTQSLLWVEM